MLYLYDGKGDGNNWIILRVIKEIKYGIFDDWLDKRSKGEGEVRIIWCLWCGYEWMVIFFIEFRDMVGSEACFGGGGKVMD